MEIKVKNRGHLRSPESHIEVEEIGFGSSYLLPLSEIDPQESQILEFQFPTRNEEKQREFVARVDLFKDVVLEIEEDNNELSQKILF